MDIERLRRLAVLTLNDLLSANGAVEHLTQDQADVVRALRTTIIKDRGRVLSRVLAEMPDTDYRVGEPH